MSKTMPHDVSKLSTVQHAPSMTMKPAIGPKGQTASKDGNSGLQQRPYEFVFQSHFDENGALYFLGSFGKKRLY